MSETECNHTTKLNLACRVCDDARSSTRFVATINTPGYLPWDDDPPVFEGAREAWRYLADERIRQEDDFADESFEGFSATANTLEAIADGVLDRDDVGLDLDWTGSIYGDTPGYGGEHDLGLAYSVSVVEEES